MKVKVLHNKVGRFRRGEIIDSKKENLDSNTIDRLLRLGAVTEDLKANVTPLTIPTQAGNVKVPDGKGSKGTSENESEEESDTDEDEDEDEDSSDDEDSDSEEHERLNSLKVSELREIADKKGIDVSGLKKNEIVDAIIEAD